MVAQGTFDLRRAVQRNQPATDLCSKVSVPRPATALGDSLLCFVKKKTIFWENFRHQAGSVRVMAGRCLRVAGDDDRQCDEERGKRFLTVRSSLFPVYSG